MTEQEKIHLKACDFAHKRREEIIETRNKLGEKPLTHDELKMRLFDAVRMIKNPNISNFVLRLKRIEDCLQENKE